LGSFISLSRWLSSCVDMSATNFEKQANDRVKDGDSAGAIDAAQQALDLYRGEGNTKGMRGSLDTLIQAYALKKNSGEGFKIAHKELEQIRGKGDMSGEAGLLEMLMHAHATLGEPVSGSKYAKEALDIYRSLGDKAGEASVLHSMAEMSRALGEMSEAQHHSEVAVKIFKKLGDKEGEDQALNTLSKVLVDRGFSEKAPKRKDAGKALRDLAKAVETKNKNAFIKAEVEVDKMSSLLEDGDIEEILHPILQKDPANIEFLEEQGWTVPRAQEDPTRIKQYPHKAFYLNTIMGGMGFGPQFRVVNPHRVDNENNPFGSKIAISVSQLAETEAWQMELGYRPGLLDSGLQQLGTLGFP